MCVYTHPLARVAVCRCHALRMKGQTNGPVKEKQLSAYGNTERSEGK